MKKRTIAAITCTALFLGCTAIIATSEPPNEPITQESSAPASAASAIALGTMSPIRNDRAIQVDSFEFRDSIAAPYTDTLTGGAGKLAVVYFQVQNTGKETGNLFFSTYKLVDSQGRSYDEIGDFMEMVTVDQWLEAQGLESSAKQLFPGESAASAKVFRVAPDAEGFEMVVNNTAFAVE